MSSNICDIEKLVQLFSTADKDDVNEDCESSHAQTKIGNECERNENKEAPSKTQKVNPYRPIDLSKRPEILNGAASADADFDLYLDETSEISSKNGWKQVPKWVISYRQSVSACDAFLGMSLKNPSTSSCENMVISIELPGEDRQNLDLKVEKEQIILDSPKFFLDMKLPHPVDPKKGNAQWSKDEEKLIVTLVMRRELDVVNF
ncbi:dynein axonemal assembly factor 6 [Dendroctonus ponderosae]|uniref:PIH1D1/2/3 CS-like domain-containing protein n=1 Tax=Dendroctonus ponderosae TaxID=77166 RepID=J3JVR2_DENPD